MRGIWGKLALLCLMAAMTPTQAVAAWNKADSKHFTVYSAGSVKELRDFTDKLEKFDFLLRSVVDVKGEGDSRPVQVFALDTVGQVRAAANNPNAAGFYDISNRNAFAVVTRATGGGKFDLGAQQILFHEYAHHFMLRYFPAAYPAWYVEGFAEFFSTVKFEKDGSIHYGNPPLYRAYGLVGVGPYPIAKLFVNDTEGLSAGEGDRYYGTAWLLTHYFQYNDTRKAEFNRYLHDIVNGAPDVTVENHFEGGSKALEKELRRYLQGKLFSTILTPHELPVVAITVSPVERGQAEVMVDELRLLRRPTKAVFAAYLPELRSDAAKFPASAYVQTLLAEVELVAGDEGAALAAADRAIAIDPKSSRALAAKASVLLTRADKSDKAEDWKAALSMIIKANRADTEDPVPLVLYYQYNARRGGEMPQVGYDGLEKAFQLLPQNPGYRFMEATALAHQKRYKAAAEMMGVIAFSPHGSAMRDAAVKMRDMFQQAEKDGTTIPLDVEAPAESADGG